LTHENGIMTFIIVGLKLQEWSFLSKKE